MREIIFLNEEFLDEGLRSRFKTWRTVQGVKRKIGSKTYRTVDGAKDLAKIAGGAIAGATLGAVPAGAELGVANIVDKAVQSHVPQGTIVPPHMNFDASVAHAAILPTAAMVGAGIPAAKAIKHRIQAGKATREQINNNPAVKEAIEKAKTTDNPKEMKKYLDSVRALTKDENVLNAVHNDYIERRKAGKTKKIKKINDKWDAKKRPVNKT